MADADAPARRGLMLVLSSPSGAGKSTLTRLCRRTRANLDLSISVTTRRGGQGSRRRALSLHRQAELRRHARPRRAARMGRGARQFLRHAAPPVEEALAAGPRRALRHRLAGHRQIVAKARDDVVSIFVLPPSMAELRARLERRAEDAPEVIASGSQTPASRSRHWSEYDYVIVNDDLERGLSRSVRRSSTAERLKRDRAIGLGRLRRRAAGERSRDALEARAR